MLSQSHVLFEDDHILVLNKPVGIAVQTMKLDELDIVQVAKSELGITGELYVTHRIDQPVSGVIVLAKNKKALQHLNDQFQNRKVMKVYWAIVQNKPIKEQDTLIHYGKKNQKAGKMFLFDDKIENGEECRLDYKWIKSSDKYHLLEVKLDTGRLHQIRAQLAHIGNVIKGDLKYGAKRSNPGGGIDLHALSINFQHPETRKQVKYIAPCREDSLWQFFCQ